MKIKEELKQMPKMCSHGDVDTAIASWRERAVREVGQKTMNKILDKANDANIREYLKQQLAKNGIKVNVASKSSKGKRGVLATSTYRGESALGHTVGYNNSLYGSISEERAIRRSALEFTKLIYGVQSD